MDYEQESFDVRLESDRELEENVSVSLEFAHKQLVASTEGQEVKNRHEGYGILAQSHIALSASLKGVKDGMGRILASLSMDEVAAVNAIASLDNSLTQVAVEAAKMSAWAKKIENDLYSHVTGEKTPLEEYADSLADGFEEVEEESDEQEDNEDGNEEE